MDSRILLTDLPNNELNYYCYEQGFDEQLLVNTEYADCFSFPICHGIPRNPVIIKHCGHFFCECCVEKQQASVNADFHELQCWLQCAVCKKIMLKYLEKNKEGRNSLNDLIISHFNFNYGLTFSTLRFAQQ